MKVIDKINKLNNPVELTKFIFRNYANINDSEEMNKFYKWLKQDYVEPTERKVNMCERI